MSRLYHELISYVEQPLAVLQRHQYLLLDYNELFSSLCKTTPKSGKPFTSVGFGSSVCDVFDEHCCILEQNASACTDWFPITDKFSKNILYLKVSFYEPATEHLVVMFSSNGS